MLDQSVADLEHQAALLDALGLDRSRSHDFDLMTELKDREASALRALEMLRGDPRPVTAARP